MLYSLDDFDTGLWVVSGREAIPPNASRQSAATHSVHSKSARSRAGDALLFGPYAASLVSAFTFGSNIYTLDSNQTLYENALALVTGQTAGNRVAFVKAPPHFGSPAFLFVCGNGIHVKVSESGHVENWGLPTAQDGMTAAIQSPAPVTVSIETFDNDASSFVPISTTVLANDATDTIDGTGSLQATIKADNTVGGFTKNAFALIDTNAGDISQTGTTVTVDLQANAPAAFAIGQQINLSGFTTDSGTIVPTGTITNVSGDTITYTATSSSTGTGHGGNAWAVFVNLNPSGSTDSDNFILYFRISQPEYLKSLLIEFDLGTNFRKDFYSGSVTTANLVAVPTITAPTDIAAMDQLGNSILNRPFTSIPPAASTQLGQEFIGQLKSYLINSFGKNAAVRPQFNPSVGAQTALQNLASTIVPADEQWWQILIPRGNFKRFGRDGTRGWQSVSGFRIKIRDRHSVNSIVTNFDDFGFQGGVGMIGNYQYVYTWENSQTGSYGNPNPTPIAVTAVNRTGVVLALSTIPVPTDPQIDTLVLWRTMGDGGTFYRLANINASNIPATITDNVSDFFGFGATISDWQAAHAYASAATILPTVSNESGYIFVANNSGTSGTQPNEPVWPQTPGATVNDNGIVWMNTGTIGGTLSLEPLLQVNTLPFITVSQAAFFAGTMFLCGDTATGARGRIYYSSPGFAEGIAGFTDVSNDDDPTQCFGTFNGQLYLFTQKHVWLIQDISVNPALPAFAAIPVPNAPGTSAPYSVVSTTNALIYQATDGSIVAFDGFYAEVIAAQILPLLMGETAEAQQPIARIVQATFNGREYIFSDGLNDTYAINVVPTSIPAHTGLSIRTHGRVHTALYYSPERGYVVAGTGGADRSIYQFEKPGQQTDNGAAINFALRTRSFYSGDKYTFKPLQLLIDCNPNGNTLAVSVSLDGVDYPVGTISGAARGNFEFTFNKSGHLLGALLTGAISAGIAEIFRVSFDANSAGTTDVNVAQ